jgi:hypothetical protein
MVICDFATRNSYLSDRVTVAACWALPGNHLLPGTVEICAGSIIGINIRLYMDGIPHSLAKTRTYGLSDG